MATKPKLSTLPEFIYSEIKDDYAPGLVVSNTLRSVSTTDDDATIYAAHGIAPRNPTVVSTVGYPFSMQVKAQSANASNATSGGNVDLITGTGTGGNKSGNVVIQDNAAAAGWNTAHLVMGTYHIWVSATGKLYIKNGAPTTDTDGTVIGTQT